MKKYIERPEYLNKLIRFKDKELVKVVTGIRRCGKSTLFDIYCDYLKSEGVEDAQIIRINLENPDFHYMKQYLDLYQYINQKLNNEKMNYIFIDEVQNVPEFQKAVDGLFIKKNCDVYITGSNAYLLSSELATLLSGRYIEIKMMPLSFKEYCSYIQSDNYIQNYQNYLINSSFPYALQLSHKEDIRTYLEGIYTSILVKDIVTRYKIADISVLESVIRYMFDNIGNVSSPNKISNSLTSMGRKVSLLTVESYLQSLVDSYILYRVDRYDMKGKKLLGAGSKYYITDIGLRYYLLGSKYVDHGHVLENIVYLELIRRGYEVYVGKMDTTEIDFIAINEYGKEYYQVSYTVLDETTLKRELSPLEKVKDHNPKYLLTMDFVPYTSHNGIKQINVLDWLLDK